MTIVKIDNSEALETTLFQNLKLNQWFLQDSRLYVKTKNTDWPDLNASEVHTMKPCAFSKFTETLPVKEVNITYKL